MKVGLEIRGEWQIDEQFPYIDREEEHSKICIDRLGCRYFIMKLNNSLLCFSLCPGRIHPRHTPFPVILTC
jgi:hypothetical protein